MSFRQNYSDFFENLKPEMSDPERFVPAVGSMKSDIMMVGEAPGANEVKEGEPFVGRAGDRLDEALEDLDLERDEIYITNLVKIRPPENRDPKTEEIEAWKPLLKREIEEVDPEIILTLGNFASKEILDTTEGITSIHGEISEVDGTKVMPIYHPAATIYDRSKMPDFKQDLEKASKLNL